MMAWECGPGPTIFMDQAKLQDSSSELIMTCCQKNANQMERQMKQNPRRKPWDTSNGYESYRLNGEKTTSTNVK